MAQPTALPDDWANPFALDAPLSDKERSRTFAFRLSRTLLFRFPHPRLYRNFVNLSDTASRVGEAYTP